MDASEEFDELRIRAEVIKVWINFDEGETDGAFFFGFLEPFQRLLLLTKQRVEARDVAG